MAAYTFGDGPWRDALVRFGYDPRTDPDSRWYQRIHLRGKTPRAPSTRGTFKAEYGHGTTPAETGPVPLPRAEKELRTPSHVFDGKTPTFSTSTFQLCDITDINIVPLIRAEGPHHLCPQPNVRTKALTQDFYRLVHSIDMGSPAIRCLYKFPHTVGFLIERSRSTLRAQNYGETHRS